MTGFLQRLAERAMGQSSPLRVATPSPFAQMPETMELAVSQAESSSTAVPAEPMPTAQTPTRARNPAGQPSHTERPNADPLVRMNDQSARPDHPAPLVADLNRLTGNRSAESREMLAATMPDTVSRERSALHDLGQPGHETRGASPHADEAGLPLPLIAAPAWQDESRLMTQPAPLLPPRADPVSSGRADLRFEVPARSHAGTVEETTEVHVSIGRIEVTAVHEAAPSPRKTPRRNAPMSLDDYLARRNGDRP